MAVFDARSWLEHLTPATCWSLLHEAQVGRIGVLVDSAPEIYPVNHVVDGETIVFRTERGNKLRGLDRSPSVCFQIDGVDVEERSGWSVLVKGRAIELTTAEDLEGVRGLPLCYWATGDKPHWIRIVPTEVTGRRVHPGVRPSREATDYPDGG